jgi:hypothetical protein
MIFKITNWAFGIKDPGALRNWNFVDLKIYVKVWHWIWCSVFIAILLFVLVVVEVTSAG